VISVVCCLSILVPFCISILYVYLFGVNVFFADEWDFVVPLRRLYRDTLSIADLFAHHNEHIYFLPYTVMLLSGTITDYNTVPLMYLVQVCIFVTSVSLFLAFRKSFEDRHSLLLFIPIPFLLFSLRQHENMLWGNQITFAFAQTFSVLALYFLHNSRNGNVKKASLLAASVSAAAASFSAVQGLLVWPAGLLQLLITPIGGSAKKLAVGSWSLIGLGIWVFYFIGYEKPKSTPPLLFVFDHPLTGISYFFTLLGGSLFWDDSLALGGGLLLACLAIVGMLLIYRGEKVQENSFWLTLLVFSFLSLTLITVGRSGFPEEQAFAQALASRFSIFSILAVVSLYTMFAKLALERRSHVITALLGVMLGVMLVSIPASYMAGMEAGAATKTYRERAAYILATYKTQPDAALVAFGHDPERVRKYARILDRLDYNVFAERPQDATARTLAETSSAAKTTHTTTQP